MGLSCLCVRKCFYSVFVQVPISTHPEKAKGVERVPDEAPVFFLNVRESQGMILLIETGSFVTVIAHNHCQLPGNNSLLAEKLSENVELL